MKFFHRGPGGNPADRTMAIRTSKATDHASPKTVATMIREAVERNGYKDVKECSRMISVPYDLFNKVVGGHIPKDAQLGEYAKKLKIDGRELILAAYRERAPADMKRYFNSVQLLENHNPYVQEILEILDSCNNDQLMELLRIARLINGSPRDYCRKAGALLELYQQMQPDVMEHFDSLVLLALRKHDLEGLSEFKKAISYQKTVRAGRRGKAPL